MRRRSVIEIKDLEFMSLHAIRYCMGRQTYMPGLIKEICRKYINKFSTDVIICMYYDCLRQEENDCYGCKYIDKPDWLVWKNELEGLLINGNNNEEKIAEISPDDLGSLMICAIRNIENEEELEKGIEICKKYISNIVYKDVCVLINDCDFKNKYEFNFLNNKHKEKMIEITNEWKKNLIKEKEKRNQQ